MIQGKHREVLLCRILSQLSFQDFELFQILGTCMYYAAKVVATNLTQLLVGGKLCNTKI